MPEGRAKTNPQKKIKPATTKTTKSPYASSSISKFWAENSERRLQPKEIKTQPSTKIQKTINLAMLIITPLESIIVLLDHSSPVFVEGS